jgi:DNA-binding NarL/FixJ family response regulator
MPRTGGRGTGPWSQHWSAGRWWKWCFARTWRRAREVLVPVAHGRTNNEIASELYITPSTVKAHLASLMRKLGARNRVEVAMWAHETGRI